MGNLQIVIQLSYCYIHKAATREGMQLQQCKLVNSRKANEKSRKRRKGQRTSLLTQALHSILGGRKRA